MEAEQTPQQHRRLKEPGWSDTAFKSSRISEDVDQQVSVNRTGTIERRLPQVPEPSSILLGANHLLTKAVLSTTGIQSHPRSPKRVRGRTLNIRQLVQTSENSQKTASVV